MRLGVALGWHVHPWSELLSLVRRAEALGYDTAFVDGDASMLPVRREADVLDGWTVTVALIAHTERIRIGSIRLVHHWNAARLAQAVATVERLAPGRLHFLITIGDHAQDARFGLPRLPARERIRWLGETLEGLRALWRGETVHRQGRYVELDGARVRPTPPGGRIPIWVAGRGPRLLEQVAAHADGWDVNLPPLRSRVAAAAAHLEAACRARERDPAEIARSLWIFTRVGETPEVAGAQFRRLNPWFRDVPDEALGEALVVGEPIACRTRIARLAADLHLELPVLDLSGLDAEATRRVLDACAPANNVVDAGI